MDRLKHLRDALDAVIVRPDDMPAVIEDMCASDGELRGILEFILSETARTRPHEIAPTQVSEGLEQSETLAPVSVPARLPDRDGSDEASSPPVGRRIGAYEIMREIGRGGMGTVYLARRADDQYHKLVAVKVLKRGMDTDSIVGRFRHERQILAHLDHPNIARLLDGGTTSDGLPYFVMEFIEGLPIDRYCDTLALPTEARLRLFQKVCAAVQYAHRNLVVHRDIKPGNILVTAEGEPKLLDFGIAKVLKSDLFFESMEATAPFMRAMTPEYASPEQVRGHVVTTASDLYSLGVLLYELLTGHRPYSFQACSLLEIERVVCGREPDKPSAVVLRREEFIPFGEEKTVVVTPGEVAARRDGTPEKLRRGLAGDLDAVVLKALEKDPSARYASVERFSADIQNHLDGLPILARRGTFFYRGAKFVRRHALGVALGAAFAAVIVGFGVVTKIQSNQIARERNTAEKVSDFLVGLFKVSEPSEARGRSVTAREILDQGAADIQTRLKDQPEVQAKLMATMGQVYAGLGMYRSARPLLETSLETRRRVFGPRHPLTADGLIVLGQVQKAQNELGPAEASMREALDIRRERFGAGGLETVQALTELAGVVRLKPDYQTAETCLREALDIHRKFQGDDHPDVPRALRNLATLLYDKGDREQAQQYFREALSIHRRTLGNQDPETARSIYNLAKSLEKPSEVGEAEALFRESLDIRRKLYGNEHPDVVRTLFTLALVVGPTKGLAAAEPYYRETIELGRKVYGPEHPEMGRFLNQWAATLEHFGRLPEAQAAAGEALAVRRKALGDEHPDVAKTRANLGVCLFGLEKYAEAETEFRAALTVLQNKLGADHKLSMMTTVWLTRTGAAQGRISETDLSNLREIRMKFKSDSESVAETGCALGECLTAARRYEEAEKTLLDTLRVIEGNRSHAPTERRTRAALHRLDTAPGKPGKAVAHTPR